MVSFDILNISFLRFPFVTVHSHCFYHNIPISAFEYKIIFVLIIRIIEYSNIELGTLYMI